MHNFQNTLIIDDDYIFTTVFSKILSNASVFGNIAVAKNGQLGIDLLLQINLEQKNLPEIIFLDLNMPVMDGWQFLEEIDNYSFRENINIYIISSTIDSYEISKALNYPFVKNFISKPINQNDLLNTLNHN